MIEKVIKRDGRIVPFDKTKIAEAIWKAAQAVGGKDKELAYKLADKVVELLEKQLKPGEIPHVEQIQDAVEKVLVENGHYKTAKAYITYRKKKEEIRKEKIKILQGFYEEEVAKKFSVNALRLMASRYLLKNEEGKLIEGPKQLFERVAMLVVIPDLLYDKRVFDKEGKQKVWEKEDFNPEEYEGKVGFKEFNVFWNRYHLERMKALYDELNSQGKMKVSWKEFFEMVKKGEFENYSKNFKEYFDLMVNKKFLPNSPTLFNAGARLGQLSACFLPTQPIITLDGVKEIVDVKVGDYVLTHNNRFRKVIEKFERPYAGYILKIYIEKLPSDVLNVTPEHPILAIKNTDLICIRDSNLRCKGFEFSRCGIIPGQYKEACNLILENREGLIKWIKAEDLEVGDYVEITYPKEIIDVKTIDLLEFLPEGEYVEINGKIYRKSIDRRKREGIWVNNEFVWKRTIPINRFVELDEELMLLFGYYLSEGEAKDGFIRFAFSKNEENIIKQIIEIFKRKFGLEENSFEIYGTNTWMSLRIHSKILSTFFYKLFNTGFSTKKIPSWMIFLPKEKQQALLAGIFLGDGTLTIRKYSINAKLVLENRDIIYKSYLMFLRIGIVPKLGFATKPKLAKIQPLYLTVSAGTEEGKNFIENAYKIKISESYKKSYNYVKVGDRIFVRIKKVDKIPYMGNVYNLEVEEDHSYSANFVGVHNCFVLDIDDNMESIMDSAKECALIFKSGGGIGINYSKLRPEGDIVASTTGTASGPVSFMKIVDVVTDVVKQGGCVSLNSFLFTNLGILKASNLPVFNPRDDYPLPVSVYDGNSYTDAFLGSIGNPQEMIAFETEHGYTLKVTSEDLVATINENGEIEFKRAIEIKENDYLVLSLGEHIGKEVRLEPINSQHFNSNKLTIPEYLSEDLAEILGIYMADGCFNNGRLIISFDAKRKNIFEYFKEKIRKTLNLEVGEIRDKSSYIDAVWFSRDLERYFEKREWKKEKSTKAFIPLDILISKKSVISAFLRGLFEGDGFVHSSGYPVLYTTSQRLAKEVQISLLSLGIISSIRKSNAKEISGHKGKEDVYTVSIIERESVEKFFSNIGFISEEKNEKVRKALNKKFEYTRVIPFAEKKLRKVYEELKKKDRKRAARFYRKAHKYMLGYRNFTFNALKNLKKDFEEVEKEFKDFEKLVCIKVKNIEKTKEEVFHIETLSGKFVCNGFLVHNKRRGANMGILEAWHPDILKFIHAKEKEGQFENFNISILLDEKFWEAYNKGEKYPLINPRNGKIVNYIDPKFLLEEAARIAWATADPGVLFLDNINRRNIQKEKRGFIRATNPCVSGDTLILTNKGLIRAENLTNEELVWTLEGWKPIEEVYDNGIKDVYKVTLENGLEIKVTEDHKFLTKEGWKMLKNLKVGDKIRIVLEAPTSFGSERRIDERFAEFLGNWIGDGSLSIDNNVSLHVGSDYSLVPYYQNIMKEFSGYAYSFERNGQYIIATHRIKLANLLKSMFGIKVSDSKEKIIPDIIFTQEKSIQAAVLRGLFTADGSVYDAKGTVTISLSSSSKKLLQQVQLMLLSFGIFSSLKREKKPERKNIKGKIYDTKGTWRLLIEGVDVKKFKEEIGLRGEKLLKLEKLLANKKFYKKDKSFQRIVSIEYVGKERVYDIRSPPTFTWTTNGIYSYDCGEQPLYPYESCNLGSINLYSLIKFDEKGNAYFDWEEYKKVIEVSYRFLDNIIDVNKYPIEKIDKASKATRRIGLGYMGLADAMFALKIPYSSEEGFNFIQKVSEFLTYYAMKNSVERAKERGVFPYYDLTTFGKGEMPIEGFYHPEIWSLDWKELQQEIIKFGLRNVDLTTVAPTGSISMFFDVSSGIEPQFSLVFEKRVTVGSFYYVDIEFERQLKQAGLYSEEILKKIADNSGSVQGIEEIPEKMRRVFVTALDIPWWDHVRAQAVAQLWITNSISKTINMPSFATVEDVLQAYLAAYYLGCKGITVYREGSKTKQVLYVKGNVEENRIKEYLKLIKNDTWKILKKFGLKEPKWINSLGTNSNGKIDKCPDCSSINIVYQAGCINCLDCGWSICVI